MQSDALSMREYDLIADWYWTDRGQTVGVAQALAVAATLPAGLVHSRPRLRQRRADYGSARNGHRVVGLDTSTGMLTRVRANLPSTPIVRGDARNCPLSNGSFDAAVSWGMLFHLPRAEQAAAVASVSRVLKPGASYLFTAADPAIIRCWRSTASHSSTFTMIPASARTFLPASRSEP